MKTVNLVPLTPFAIVATDSPMICFYPIHAALSLRVVRSLVWTNPASLAVELFQLWKESNIVEEQLITAAIQRGGIGKISPVDFPSLVQRINIFLRTADVEE